MQDSSFLLLPAPPAPPFQLRLLGNQILALDSKASGVSSMTAATEKMFKKMREQHEK